MTNFLNKAYRFNDDLKSNVKSIIVITLVVFVFLLVFQPFKLNILPYADKFLLISAIVLITFFSLSINLLVVPSYLPGIFLRKEWKVWKEILWDLWILVFIVFCYLIFYKAFVYFFPEKRDLMPAVNAFFIFNMILTAVIPITILVTINRNRLLRLHLQTANELNRKLRESKESHEKLVVFESEYQKEKLSIKARLVVLIRSADNYVEVFWKDEGLVKRQLIRNSLKNIEGLLEDYAFLYRCHRSYLININYIDRVEGQSQGYRLYFEGLDFTVPISKTAVDKLEELIRLM